MKPHAEQATAPDIAETIRVAAQNRSLMKDWRKLAQFAAKVFLSAGTELHVVGHLVGSDRGAGVSLYGYGSDEAVPAALFSRIGPQTVSATHSPFEASRVD